MSGREDRIIMPDTVNLIIWLIAGVAGGNAAGDLLKGDYDLGLETRLRSNRRRCRCIHPPNPDPSLEGHRLWPHHRPADSSRRQWGRSDGHRRRCDLLASKPIGERATTA